MSMNAQVLSAIASFYTGANYDKLSNREKAVVDQLINAGYAYKILATGYIRANN